jgi:hypothetical protein
VAGRVLTALAAAVAEPLMIRPVVEAVAVLLISRTEVAVVAEPLINPLVAVEAMAEPLMIQPAVVVAVLTSPQAVVAVVLLINRTRVVGVPLISRTGVVVAAVAKRWLLWRSRPHPSSSK